MRIGYTVSAITDLEQIELYYAERTGAHVAQEYVERIKRTLDRLIAKNPRIGRLRPELLEGMRSFPVLPYIVFYRIEGRRVWVERVLHGHRDIRPPLASLLVAV